MMASMFHSLYAISVQLSPVTGSSGIQRLEADTFTLHCNQTVTGVKFVVVADSHQVRISKRCEVDCENNKIFYNY